MFLGHQNPAGEIAKFVLAASALVAPYLKTMVDRIFPYTNLTQLDKLLSFPGFIAGVANPTFQAHDAWWDILCDIPSGKVMLSPRLNSSSAYGWNTEPASNAIYGDQEKDGKERELIAFDNDFMAMVVEKMRAKPSESSIRALFSAYVKRFLDLGSLYEYERISSMPQQPISQPTINSPKQSINSKSSAPTAAELGLQWPLQDKVPGPRAVRIDSSTKAKDFSMFARRISAWRGTASYNVYLSEWTTWTSRRLVQCYLNNGIVEMARLWPWIRHLTDSTSLTAAYWQPWVDDTDSSVLINKLRDCDGLDTSDLNFAYDSLLRNANDDQFLLEVVSGLMNIV